MRFNHRRLGAKKTCGSFKTHAEKTHGQGLCAGIHAIIKHGTYIQSRSPQAVQVEVQDDKSTHITHQQREANIIALLVQVCSLSSELVLLSRVLPGPSPLTLRASPALCAVGLGIPVCVKSQAMQRKLVEPICGCVCFAALSGFLVQPDKQVGSKAQLPLHNTHLVCLGGRLSRLQVPLGHS